MEATVLMNYWLLTAACTIIGIVSTIFIFKYDAIVSFLKRKLTWIKRDDKTRDIVYEVMKDLTPHTKRFIRAQVRSYLKELQKPSYAKEKIPKQNTSATGKPSPRKEKKLPND